MWNAFALPVHVSAMQGHLRLWGAAAGLTCGLCHHAFAIESKAPVSGCDGREGEEGSSRGRELAADDREQTIENRPADTYNREADIDVGRAEAEVERG